MKTANKYKVCKKMWNKWDEVVRKEFNNTYELLKDQTFLLGGNMTIDKKAYETIRWNVAFLMACSTQTDRKQRDDWLKRMISHVEHTEVKKIVELIRSNI